jgi:ankyrin repeat protein
MGADVNYQNGYPLLVACRETGNHQVIKVLLENDSCVSEDALFHAIQHKDLSLVELLLATLSGRDSHLRSIEWLEKTIRSLLLEGEYDIANAFLRHCNERKNHSIMMSLWDKILVHWNLLTLRLAIENLELDIHFLEGHPIRRAVSLDRLPMVEFLVERGANIHINNEQPLRIAVYFHFTDIVKFLLRKGADPRVANNEPIRLAKNRNHTEMVKIIQHHFVVKGRMKLLMWRLASKHQKESRFGLST